MSHALRSMQQLTQAEFFDWARDRECRGDRNRYELLDGVVIVTPPAGYPHGHIETRISAIVSNFVDAHRLGVVLGSSQGFDLPTGDTLEPDLSFVSNARWKAAPKPEVGKFLRVVPDLVVEILSTKTARRDRTAKRAAYERAGIREYWLVDPWHREVLQLTREGRKLAVQTVCTIRLSSSVLRGLVVDVRKLLADP